MTKLGKNMDNKNHNKSLDETLDSVNNFISTAAEDSEYSAPWWQRFVEGLNEFYHAPYRQTMARAARDEEDFFMLLMFAESLGIDNPASFYTLELQPLFLENFHEWHTRMGMDRCPFDHVGCC
jgi:hypothetical protein